MNLVEIKNIVDKEGVPSALDSVLVDDIDDKGLQTLWVDAILKLNEITTYFQRVKSN